MIIPIGTVINVGMVLAGTLIGVLVGGRMPELGWGIALSILTLIFVQGGITVAAALLDQQVVGMLAAEVVPVGEQSLARGAVCLSAMMAAGRVALLAPGLVILDLKCVRVADLLPALAMGPAIVLALFLLGVLIAP